MIADVENFSKGGADILVNNAGIQHVAPVETFPVNIWNTVLDINLTAAFHTIRLSLPGMKKKNWGRIINIASVHGLVGYSLQLFYKIKVQFIIDFYISPQISREVRLRCFEARAYWTNESHSFRIWWNIIV